MDFAIGIVVFWLTLAVYFAVRLMSDDVAEKQKRDFLDKWDSL